MKGAEANATGPEGGLDHSGLNSTLARNISALRSRHKAEDAAAPFQDKFSDLITGFAGSLTFVYLHLAIVAAWVATNLGWIPGAPRFDRTFVILATAASVEAIFLSTFVLISQNRATARANRRDELDLHINLLTEHEVTRLISLTTSIAEHLGIEVDRQGEFAELQQDVQPETVLDSMSASDEGG
jgi:uncharacterized membrane protein